MKADIITVFLTRLAKTSTERGGGTRSGRSEEVAGPDKEDAAKWDSGFAPKSY